jgi:uncharacterized protein (DUF362 family)
MKRRNFLSNTLKAGLLAGPAIGITGSELLANSVQNPNTDYDLVAVKGGEPAAMLDKALESLGGIQRFVKKGQHVLVKPNIGWDATPERAANTNPQLVKRLIELCKQAGASRVSVFDKTCNDWQKCYANSGIEKAVKEAGGIMVPGNAESYYKPVNIPQANKLKNVKVHDLYLTADVIINVPVLKHHSGTTLTIAMKNLMGVVWDRWFWHENDLHRCIAEFPRFKMPHLNIVDAYNVMLRNGPRGVSVDDISNMKALLVSTDIVAIDAAAVKLFGMEPDDIGFVKIAHELGLGNKNLDKLKINRISM